MHGTLARSWHCTAPKTFYGRNRKEEWTLDENSKTSKERVLAEINQRLADPDDPVTVLVALWEATSRLNSTLSRLTENDNYASTLQILEAIETSIVQAEWYIREEAYAFTAGTTQGQGNHVHFTKPLPEGVSLTWSKDRPQFRFPLWMFGFDPAKEIPPPWHEKRPYVREQVWWNALISQLTHCSPGFDPRCKPEKQSILKLCFITRMHLAKDLDHVRVSPLVNALVYNGLLFSDHPMRLKYQIEWQEAREEDMECLEVTVLDGCSTP